MSVPTSSRQVGAAWINPDSMRTWWAMMNGITPKTTAGLQPVASAVMAVIKEDRRHETVRLPIEASRAYGNAWAGLMGVIDTLTEGREPPSYSTVTFRLKTAESLIEDARLAGLGMERTPAGMAYLRGLDKAGKALVAARREVDTYVSAHGCV